MTPQLKRSFDRLEKERRRILLLIDPLTEEQFSRSVDGKWSVAQILTHIVTSENLALGYMKKKSLGLSSLPDSGFSEVVKLGLLKISQRLPIRYKVPKGIEERTPEPLDKQSLLKQWEAVRGELHALLSGIDKKHNRKLVFKHPVAGMFNAWQGVSFMREHLLHHLPQIQRHLK